MIYQLPDDEIVFPDPHEAEDDGLLAIGGDLSEQRLVLAYRIGIFPWYSFRDIKQPVWFCPKKRFVIFPNEIHVSHSMRNLLNKNQYHFTINRDFDRVIRACSTVQDRFHEEGAWLGEEVIAAYTRLNRLGYATSVEVWDKDEKLAGGLYGVTMCKCFIGESMFSLVPNGSKIALIALARILEENGWKFIDCQLETPHLRSMGARYIDYDEYMEIMNR